ncbi:MAG: M28 family peptidase [Planctomycetota bacterium]|nr:M28 family peptidase [Planctomycetota bacterium]
MRTPLFLAVTLTLALLSLPTFAEESIGGLVTDVCEADLRAHLETFASDEMKGRESLTPEGVRAAEYVAARFKEAGVVPHGADGTYFQPYVIQQPVLQEGNELEVARGDDKRAYAVEKDWNPFSVCPATEIKGSVVFAGYGINAPRRQWNDYAGVDVKGKIVLIFRKNPGWRESQHASFRRKLQVAVQQGAAAVLLCNNPDTTKAAGRDQIGHWSGAIGLPRGSAVIPYAFVSQQIAAQILGMQMDQLEDLETTLRKDGPQSRALEGVEVRLRTAVATTSTANTRNVVGLLPGRDPELAEEVIVIGAHYDHLGLGTYGSLGGRSAAGKIHNGADDNGSGTVTLMELAAWFGAVENRPRRSLLFIAFSGEERGLLGSRHYVENPSVPLDDIVAMLNMDMVGRSRDGRMQIGGVGTAKGLQQLVAKENEPYKLRIQWDPQGTAPTDSTSFFRKRIPVLFFFTGLHKDYHRPSDDVELINFPDMLKIAHLVRDVATEIGNREERLEFTMPPQRRMPPILGVQPSPEENPDGLLISRVTPNGPAAKGGMQDGDVIVSVASQVVRDLQSLRGVLGKLQAGKTVRIVVLRGDERKTLQVTLAPRPGRRGR